jgi:hypothetical protein
VWTSASLPSPPTGNGGLRAKSLTYGYTGIPVEEKCQLWFWRVKIGLISNPPQPLPPNSPSDSNNIAIDSFQRQNLIYNCYSDDTHDTRKLGCLHRPDVHVYFLPFLGASYVWHT